MLLAFNVYIIRRVYSGRASFVAQENSGVSLKDEWDESQVLKGGLGKHPQFS